MPDISVTHEDGRKTHVSLHVARRMLDSGVARVVSKKPLAIEVVPVERVRSALIPRDCPEFRDEYIRNCNRSLGRCPSHLQSPEWIAVRKLMAALDRSMVPLPPPAKTRPVRKRRLHNKAA